MECLTTMLTLQIENLRSGLNYLKKEYKVNTSEPISNFIVPTTDTVSFQFLLRQYVSVGHSPLLVGNSG